MRKVILIMLLSVVSNSAMAEWVQAGGYGLLTIYVDPSTIRKEGNIVKMWNLFDYKTAQREAGGMMYMSIKGQEEFDCKEGQMRVLYFSYYSGNMGYGESVYTNSVSNKWQPVVPDSTGEHQWEFACGKQ